MKKLFLSLLIILCISSIKTTKLSSSAFSLNYEIINEPVLIAMYSEIEEIEVIDKREIKVIFIGDSRFVGMEMSKELNDNEFTIAEVGRGHSYLINTALPKLKNIIENNDYKYKIIFGLGINDLLNIDKYIETYNSLEIDEDLYFLSVNPIGYHSIIDNSEIEKFNSRIKNETNLKYIDTYSELMNNIGFSTTDGLHYTNKTYIDIYNLIKLDLSEEKLELNLEDENLGGKFSENLEVRIQ